MSYANIISFRVGDELHTDLLALATARPMDVGKLLRSLVSRELQGTGHHATEQREMIIFLAIAMDGLLRAQPDPQLRQTVVKLWRERLAEEQADAR